MSDVREKRDLVLPPGCYAYMQDVTKGVIKIYTGPTVINPTAQEAPIVYEPKEGIFKRAGLEEAVRKSPVAVEGYYVVLLNPAKANKHPDEGNTQPSPELDIGRKIIVPGPVTFALWPGQAAQVVRGHHLRSNQYLLVRVYNEEEARKNWNNAVIKLASGEVAPQKANPLPADLTIGKQLIIKGTEVSFYIPPTGITVVATGNNDNVDRYVREALTLERLEYCILVDENGKKRYEVGPQVVFPLPSERFIEAKDEHGRPNRKFRAVELNEIQGLHIKVIAPYEENGVKYAAGQELFITGKDTQIYYPREEHSAVKYDGKSKHFATAVPAGEARYVLNRLSGDIRMEMGPAMLLPDPRNEVIVRRTLTDRQCALWYPGNQEVLAYNQAIRNIMLNAPTTRAGAISEGDLERGMKTKGSADKGGVATRSAGTFNSGQSMMESSRVSGDQALVGEDFSRSSSYTQPRTVTLDTKYQGAPSIDVWTGYSVLVVSKTGGRRVERGPKTVLLAYDEALEVLEMSTGKPKTTDNLLRTVYLRTENNKVADVIDIETVDHVKVQLKLSYRVNFEGDPMKWFSVENYVKFLCDHARSVLKGAARKIPIEHLYRNSTDWIRSTLLGAGGEGARPGMLFPENGMRMLDVEVLSVALYDEKIRQLLDTAQHEVVQTNISLSMLHRGLEVTREKAEAARTEAEIVAATQLKKDELARQQLNSQLATSLTGIANSMKEVEEKKKLTEAMEAIEEMKFAARLERTRRERVQEDGFVTMDQERQIEMLTAQADSAVKRFEAAKGGFTEALLTLSNHDTLVKVAQAWNTQKLVEGEALGDTLHRLFNSTPLKAVVDKLVSSNGKTAAGSISPVMPPA